MTAPIPLAAPDGTVYAYACGRCKCPWQDDWIAGVCCTEPRCPACLCCVRDEGLCERCDADARSAFEALACIGMAVAVREYANTTWRPARDEALAALCGVDVETVRGWRSA